MQNQVEYLDLTSLYKVLRVSLTGLTFVGSLWSCGPDETHRDYNNPVDPNRAVETTSSTSPSAVSTCLAGDCNPPSGSSFNFASSVSLSPPGCSKVADVKVIDRGTDLIVFALAYCTDRYHLYSSLMTYEGTFTSAAKLISSDCNQTGGDVKSFAASRGTTAYLASYVCKTASSSFSTRVIPVGSDGTAGTASIVETLSFENKYNLVWNGVAGAYGLIRTGRMQRFSESGLTLGGPIAINPTNVTSVQIVDGNWLLLQRDGNYAYSTCSRIATNGTLQCNSSSDSRDVTSFLGNNLIIKGTSFGEISLSDLNAATCSISGGSKVDRTFNISYAMQFYNSIPLTTNMAAVLVSTSDTLFLATFPSTGEFKINAESSVSKIGTAPLAEVQRIKDKVYVSWASEGKGALSWSTEKLP